MDEHQWASPLEWLLDRIANAESLQCKIIANRLARKLDADTIQDLYQDEMAEDGYFIQAVADENKWRLANG